MPFQHDIAGGQGNLIVTAVKSPNFVHGVSGWQIAKDGSAEFQDVILPAGTGGTVVTFSATAPGSPSVGDVWYDTAAGLEANVWSGSAWVPYQISTGAIANAAITTAQLAASVTARSIGGVTTTIATTAPGSPLAGDLWIDSANGYQIQQYSGSAWTPISWNASNVIQAGTVTATQIAANTITASQLAAGIVYAGIINGTTVNAATFTGSVFEGTDFVINSSGAFFYSGTPAAGNLIASITNTSGTDAHGNAYQAGIFMYEATSSGNALGGLMWNTVAGSQPLLALFPDSTVGFTDHSPFITSQVFNRGAANEYLALSLGGGAATGSSSPVLINLFGLSKDSTLAPHISFYAGSSANLVADISGAGIKAANPASPGNIETWHNITKDSGWSNVSGYSALQYRLLPDGNVQVTGGAQHTSLSSTLAINSSNPLPSQYIPASSKTLSMGNSPLSNLQVEVRTDGVLYALANASATGTKAVVDATYPLIV